MIGYQGYLCTARGMLQATLTWQVDGEIISPAYMVVNTGHEASSFLTLKTSRCYISSDPGGESDVCYRSRHAKYNRLESGSISEHH